MNLELSKVPSLQRCGQFCADRVSTLGLMRSLKVSVLSQKPSKDERSGVPVREGSQVVKVGVRCHRSPESTTTLCSLVQAASGAGQGGTWVWCQEETHGSEETSWKDKACVCSKLLQSCLTLCDPMDRSPRGSSVHGVLQARLLERVAMPSSRRSS